MFNWLSSTLQGTAVLVRFRAPLQLTLTHFRKDDRRLKLNKWATLRPRVVFESHLGWEYGDIVTGAATVILAMGAGKVAAVSIT